MNKLLLAFSVAALLYGDCAFGMDYDKNELYENPEKDMKSESGDMQKPISRRLERQKRQLRQLNAEFKTNQEENEKLRKEFKRTDKNPDNGSKKVKKMVEQIEQRSRPSFGIEVNHKPANLVLGKKNKQLFDKETTNDIDWESKPPISNLEQKEIRETKNQSKKTEQGCQKKETLSSNQSQVELINLQREKIAKYESALQKLTQQLKEEREKNRLVETREQGVQTDDSQPNFIFSEKNKKDQESLQKQLVNAITKRNLSEVKDAIKNGADVNAKDKDGSSLLCIAAQNGHLEIVKYLVTHGADIDESNPLMEAIYWEHLEIVKFLVEHGANINKVDNYGWTPLFVASRYGHLEAVKYLVKHDADISKADNDGWTPLHFASEYGYLDIVEFLVEHGAAINSKTNIAKITPLYIATQNQRQNIVNYLTSKGAK